MEKSPEREAVFETDNKELSKFKQPFKNWVEYFIENQLPILR